MAKCSFLLYRVLLNKMVGFVAVSGGSIGRLLCHTLEQQNPCGAGLPMIRSK